MTTSASQPQPPVSKQGFVARLQFTPESAKYYSPEGYEVVEMLYPEDEDIFELIEFMQDHEDYIVGATVLLPDGKVIDARELSTHAQED